MYESFIVKNIKVDLLTISTISYSHFFNKNNREGGNDGLNVTKI